LGINDFIIGLGFEHGLLVCYRVILVILYLASPRPVVQVISFPKDTVEKSFSNLVEEDSLKP
jgi:hypothetical protein